MLGKKRKHLEEITEFKLKLNESEYTKLYKIYMQK